MLPTLYKTNKNLTIQYYTITTKDDTYTVEFGQLGTDSPQFKTTKCYPKNENRSNATTANQQAISEAKSKHAKKIKAGYSTDQSAPKTERTQAMKVKSYKDNLKNIVFPAFSSEKLDGHNGMFKLIDNTLHLYSRTGEEYLIPTQLVEPVTKDLIRANTDELNCELYSPKLSLQKISSAVKKHNENTHLLQAYVFDYPNIDKPFKDKVSTLLNSELPHPSITEVFNHDDIEAQHTLAIEAGYEGTVIRNQNLQYQHGTRSSNAFKYKIALDTERLIIDYSIDKNNHTVFLVGDKDGNKTFKVKMTGTNEERLKVAAIADSYIGKWLNLSYEALSDNGICLKPVGNYIRDCDDNGNPRV